MGKQRKSTSDKLNKWRFAFKSSSEDCRDREGKKSIPSRLRNRFEGHNHGLGHGLPPSISATKSKKVSCLTSKCHAVGIASLSSNGGSFPSASSLEQEEQNNDESVPEDDDNETTYALISECQLMTVEPVQSSENESHPPLLKPLYFEVPQEEEHQLVERCWIYGTIADIFATDGNTRGMIIHGNPGTGKTTIALQLVENSCFGRNVKMLDQEGNNAPLKKLASKIVAYHFCQVDNRNTCLVSDFVHSVAAQMCQAPGFSAYRIFLEENPHSRDVLSSHNCLIDPNKAFNNGIIQPLIYLRKNKMLVKDYFILILDSIDEAESHRPGSGDTISSFLSKHVLKIPPWFKIIITIRTNQLGILDLVPFKLMSLDTMDDHVDGDVRQYVSTRLKNLEDGNKSFGNVRKIDPSIFPGLKTHLLQLSGSCFLFLKLTIDIIEHGHLVLKPNNFKGLPVSLQEVFLLHCNLRFPTGSIFNAVAPILSTCLVALNPLNLLEIYHSVNSLRFKDNLPWVEFLRLFKSVQGLLVKRLDATYMYFHCSFRDWLLGKDVGNSRFQCSPEMGHAAIVLRLLRVERPLSVVKLLDLAHHLLKAKCLKPPKGELDNNIPFRYSQALLLLGSCENLSAALGSWTNIYKTNLKVSRLLLLSGASPTTKCPLNGKSVVEICAAEGNLELLDLLIEFGMDIDGQNDDGDTLLHIAAANGQLAIVGYLMENGASPNQVNCSMECPMVLAALAGQTNVVEFLLKWNWDKAESRSRSTTNLPKSKHESIMHSLVTCCALGRSSSVAKFLEKCPYLNLSSTFKGMTPLVGACKSGQSRIVKMLLKSGVNVNSRDEDGVPPLIHAVKGGHYNILDILLSHEGCVVDATDINGRTALIHSVQLGDIISVEILINHRCDLNKRDADGLSALGWACFAANAKMISHLLQYPVNMEDSDNAGRAALHIAASSRHEDIVQALLDTNAPLEQTDFQGNRPLDYAAEFSSPEIVKLLLRKGAKLSGTVWKKAANNPQILLVLFNKLLEDGKFLYQNGQISEAEHRFEYALRKLDLEGERDNDEDAELCQELRNKFLLEMLKCQKKKNKNDLKEYLQQEFGYIQGLFDLSELKQILEKNVLCAFSKK